MGMAPGGALREGRDEMTDAELLEKIGPLVPGHYILVVGKNSVSREQVEHLPINLWRAEGIVVTILGVHDVQAVRLLRVEKPEVVTP